MARRMADKTFREDQWKHRYASHIAPLNELVDALRASSGLWLPYVGPMYGGINASLLSLLRDPGPMTQVEGGSGFLSMENDDATAAALADYFAQAGIDAERIVPWNAYPWYINRAPRAAEIGEGIEPLKALIDLMPKLRVVMLHGGTARDAWKRFSKLHHRVVRGLRVIPTYHTSRQAFWHSDAAERQRRREHLRAAFHEAAHALSP